MIIPNLLDDFVSKNKFKPNQAQLIRYLFFDKGIDLNTFNKLPLPYIMEMVEIHSYLKEQEEKELKKAQKR